MYLKVKNVIEDLTGFSFYRKNLPWGLNIYKDIKRLVPHWSPQVIFDVGANMGQTAVAFHDVWPNAQIFSFEPVQNTFNVLEKSVDKLPNVKAVPLALGSASGEATIKIFSNSRLASLDHEVSVRPAIKYEQIKISTVDEFCDLHSIDRVCFLKIDTEGHDLEVLKGSISYLKNSKIDFVLAEFSTTSMPGKVTITDIDELLRKYDMTCVGIYDQAFWKDANIYFGNVLFVREGLIFKSRN
ncbi:FkbM family methyltransferase [Aliinostoc sp. HNIBRCY26]|uniref:FkbM family methyltransferase n=1 Tax=Aliinostoc sp. HNIBRCY26 TaxID=3418997 RepID=UPI003D059F40